MPDKVKKGFRRYCTAVMAAAVLCCCTVPAFAADDPLAVINNLSNFIFGLIRAVGLILLGWGIVQVGLSLQSHDPSQRSNGFLTLAGGIVITFAKELLTLITGGYDTLSYSLGQARCLPRKEVLEVSDNWVVQNLTNALETWNDKLSEIWLLITQSPENFKGGAIWSVIVSIHGALQAIGYALLVVFFVVGVMKTCGSFAEIKKPEHAVKLFVRFALAKGLISYGMELMLALLNIVQGVISSIMNAAGFGGAQQTVLPQEIITAVEECGFFESIPLWAVTLIGGLFIWVLSFVMILSVYGRFFKMFMYTAIAPIPLSSFAGEPSQNIGKSFLKGYAAVCLEGAIIVLACIIFSVFAASPPVVDVDAAAASMVWSYIGELIFNMLILVGSIKMADRIVHEMMGL